METGGTCGTKGRKSHWAPRLCLLAWAEGLFLTMESGTGPQGKAEGGARCCHSSLSETSTKEECCLPSLHSASHADLSTVLPAADPALVPESSVAFCIWPLPGASASPCTAPS